MSAVFKKCPSPLIFVMTLNTISDWRKNFRGNFVKIKFWDENVHVWCFSKNYLAKKNNKKLECLFSEFSLNPILGVVFGPAFRVGVCKSASTNLTYDWEKLESRNYVHPPMYAFEIYKKMFADMSIFLMASTTRHSRETEYFVNF